MILDLSQVVAHGASEPDDDGCIVVMAFFGRPSAPLASHEIRVTKESAEMAVQLAARLLGAAEHLNPQGYELVRNDDA